VILLNAKGRVTECAGSSLFLVKRGRLITPPLSEGLLPGVTREVLLEVARRLKIPCSERPVTLGDLQKADEIFITSTLKGVLPVSNLDGRRIRGPGPMTERVARGYASRR